MRGRNNDHAWARWRRWCRRVWSGRPCTASIKRTVWRLRDGGGPAADIIALDICCVIVVFLFDIFYFVHNAFCFSISRHRVLPQQGQHGNISLRRTSSSSQPCALFARFVRRWWPTTAAGSGCFFFGPEAIYPNNNCSRHVVSRNLTASPIHDARSRSEVSLQRSPLRTVGAFSPPSGFHRKTYNNNDNNNNKNDKTDACTTKVYRTSVWARREGRPVIGAARREGERVPIRLGGDAHIGARVYITSVVTVTVSPSSVSHVLRSLSWLSVSWLSLKQPCPWT